MATPFSFRSVPSIFIISLAISLLYHLLLSSYTKGKGKGEKGQTSAVPTQPFIHNQSYNNKKNKREQNVIFLSLTPKGFSPTRRRVKNEFVGFFERGPLVIPVLQLA
jgi:hypothetical protein